MRCGSFVACHVIDSLYIEFLGYGEMTEGPLEKMMCDCDFGNLASSKLFVCTFGVLCAML